MAFMAMRKNLDERHRKKNFDEIFKKFDHNHNQRVSIREFTEVERYLRKRKTTNYIDDHFLGSDADGNTEVILIHKIFRLFLSIYLLGFVKLTCKESTPVLYLNQFKW